MKPITKYLAAGSLAAAFLFASKEGFDFSKLLHRDVAPKQAIIQESITTLPPVAAPLPKALPLALTISTENSANEVTPVETGNTYDLKHAVVLPYKQSAFSRKIDVAKLIKKIKTTSVAIHLNANALANDSAMVTKSAVTTEAIAQQEKLAVANQFSEPQKSGGSAYHAAKAETKTGKNTKSPIDISAFSSIKQADNGADSYTYSTVYEGTEALKEFAIRNGNNTDYAIMVNLGLKSGKKRFFVIDLSSNTIIKCGIVAEGSGDVSASFEKKYSNEIGSSATSLGIFKIGKRANKDAYRLQGLQESNSNAFKRAMMLQAADDVQNDEINFPTLKTNGSLSLSTSFFKEISTLLDASAKPVLLWVYDQTAESQAAYSAVQKTK